MEDESTNKRMNDFADRVGRFEGDVKERFDKVDQRFDRFEGDVKENFAKVDARFDKLEGKVDSTNRTIWAGIFVAVIVKIIFG
jgi:tetrahydromethanopterin S-methyltransferase subunit G